MKILLLSILFISFQLYSQTKSIEIDSITISKSENGHSFILKLARKPFDKIKHDVSKIDHNIIDKSTIYGVDGDLPIHEFSRFELIIDNRVVTISSKVYNRFYNPNIGYKDGAKYVNAYFGNDYKTVFIYMNGSDGAGAYSVTWCIDITGKYSYSLIPIYDMYFNMNYE